MPGRWDRRGQTDEELAATFGGEKILSSQSHDNTHGDRSIPALSSTRGMADETLGVEEMDITAGQKMISAMSGSLLTSLLGEFS